MKKLRKRPESAFTLIEVMIVVVIIGVILNIAIPNMIRSRERARSRSCIRNLRTIDGAKEAWAIENRKPAGTPDPGMSTLVPYMKTTPQCPSGGTYTPQSLGAVPTCNTSGGPFPHVFSP